MFCLNTGISASNTEFNMNYTHKKHNNQNIFKQRKRGAYRRQNTRGACRRQEHEAHKTPKNRRREYTPANIVYSIKVNEYTTRE